MRGVPQVSTGLLLFLIQINNLNKAVSLSKIHHFAEDTNFLYESKSLRTIKQEGLRMYYLMCLSKTSRYGNSITSGSFLNWNY